MKIVLEKDEVSWQAILYDLVKKEGMDPFDIDVSKIAQSYLDNIREMKNHDFRLSGKVVLAAAIMLKLKSNKLVGHDLNELDRLLTQPEFDEAAFFDEIHSGGAQKQDVFIPELIPRTPQPRKRKVSIHDLVWALQKALEVKRRRVLRHRPPAPMDAPERKFDVSKLIKGIFAKLVTFFNNKQEIITFSNLTPSKDKNDIITTLIPLLHLANERKVELSQQEHFGEIYVKVLDTTPLPDESAAETLTV